MAKIFPIILPILLACSANCQDFITHGKIEFEVRERVEEYISAFDISNGSRQEGPSTTSYDIYYMELLFSGNQWTYKRGSRKSSVKYEIDDEDVDFGALYVGKQAGTYVKRKRFIDETSYVFQDSLPSLKWKIQNETRKIAGWECRKALTVIHDSVYVVAFYCPEIIPQGGPELFTGLPGMILGLAIPRERKTWFATKIELANIDETKIVAPGTKKEKVHNKQELADILFTQLKKTGWWKEVTIEKVRAMLTSYFL